MAEPLSDAADALADAEDADILLYNGEISRRAEYKFIEIISRRKRRSRVVLILVTPGGDPDAAYRMARCLQFNYEHVTLAITGWCKSAGTLLAIGAHRLVMSQFGELGPLDVQLGKRDELFEYGSGLDIGAAMKQLEALSFAMFERVMMAIETSSGGRITFKTASELSYEMVTKLFGNLYARIDPIEIGKTSRLMTIATDYGQRLHQKAKNFKRDDALDLLTSSYSSHSFVIDFEEASEIFANIEAANPLLERLQSSLGQLALYPIENVPGKEYVVCYLSKEISNEPALSEGQAGGHAGASAEESTAGHSAGNAGKPGPDSGPTDGTPIPPPAESTTSGNPEGG